MPLASVDLMAVSCPCPKNVQARGTRTRRTIRVSEEESCKTVPRPWITLHLSCAIVGASGRPLTSANSFFSIAAFICATSVQSVRSALLKNALASFFAFFVIIVESSGRRISLQRPTCGRPGPHISHVARIAPLGRDSLNFLSAPRQNLRRWLSIRSRCQPG